MNEDRLDKMIREAARNLGDPPPAPRDEMWAEIDRRRQSRRGGKTRVFPFPRRVWVPMAAAAVLALGFALGRIAVPLGDSPVEQARVETSPASEGVPGEATPGIGTGDTPTRENNPDRAYRVAAASFINRTDTVLSQFASAPTLNGDTVIYDWAKELLTENRLLIDTNPTGDPELTRLLGDLEYVLAQIVMHGESQREDDSIWIREGMDERSILLRVRSRIPAGNPYLGT